MRFKSMLIPAIRAFPTFDRSRTESVYKTMMRGMIFQSNFLRTRRSRSLGKVSRWDNWDCAASSSFSTAEGELAVVSHNLTSVVFEFVLSPLWIRVSSFELTGLSDIFHHGRGLRSRIQYTPQCRYTTVLTAKFIKQGSQQLLACDIHLLRSEIRKNCIFPSDGEG